MSDTPKMNVLNRQQSIEEQMEERQGEEPLVFQLYFRFLLWRWGKWIIMGFWAFVILCGLIWGFSLLDVTVFVFKPPRGTSAYQAKKRMKKYFPEQAKTELVLFYFSCPDWCKKQGNAIDSHGVLSNMSRDINQTMMTYGHSGIITDYTDYYIARQTCELSSNAKEYAVCEESLHSLYISNNSYHAFATVSYKAENTDKITDMNDWIKNKLRKISKDYDQKIKVKITSQKAMTFDMNEAAKSDVESTDVITIPLAMIVLSMVVRSWRTLLLPLICVLGSICASFTIMYPIAKFAMDFSPFAPSIMMSVTIAMSIDYSLFLLTRFREEIAKQEKDFGYNDVDAVDAIRQMTRWSGHVVGLSGCILSITYIGLVFYPMSMLQSVGLGTSIAVLCTICVNLTLTPAIMMAAPEWFGILGFTCARKREQREQRLLAAYEAPKPEAVEVKGHGRRGSVFLEQELSVGLQAGKDVDDVHPFEVPEEDLKGVINCCNKCWYECGSYSTAWPYNLIAVLVIYALIAPIGWRVATMDKQLDSLLVFPRDSNYLLTYKDIRKTFSAGMLAPWHVVIPDKQYDPENGRDVTSWEYVQDTGFIMSSFYKDLNDDGYDISSVQGASVNNEYYFTSEELYDRAMNDSLYEYMASGYRSEDLKATYFTVISGFNPYYKKAVQFVSKARSILSHYCKRKNNPSGSKYKCYLSGGSVADVSSVNHIFEGLPLVLSMIILVVFGMMGLFFKSLWVPVRLFLTIALPMTLVYGLAIWVYQDGLVGSQWDAVSNTDGLYWIAPVMTVTILVGLALDYDVFLFARIYEYRTFGLPTRESIVRGIYNTGAVITAAGVIMAIAFSGLLFSQVTTLNQTGFILVVAVLVDTFIIRTTLVPSILSMAKEINWWPGIREVGTKSQPAGFIQGNSVQMGQGADDLDQYTDTLFDDDTDF